MARIQRSGSAVWRGDGKSGQGQLTTESKALQSVSYSAGMRFGEEKGTNPEELIAAAHAGCYNMALAFALSNEGHAPDELSTQAKVAIEKGDAGWTIVAVELDLKGRVPGISADEFQRIAESAKTNCPVSKVLNAAITLNAELA